MKREITVKLKTKSFTVTHLEMDEVTARGLLRLLGASCEADRLKIMGKAEAKAMFELYMAMDGVIDSGD